MITNLPKFIDMTIFMQRIQRIDILKVSEKEMKVEKGNFPNK